MPTYLSLLKGKRESGTVYVSAGSISAELGLVEIQVRKDLAAVSDGGRPKVGYVVADLILDIEKALGYNNINDAVLVGAGKLGKALLAYDGFREYGLNIVAAFDADPSVCGADGSGKPILPVEKLKKLCQRLKVHIGIITVPASAAQAVCDMLVDSGVVAVWNFAPAHLRANDGILIKSENMAASLAVLSNHLSEKISKI
jgi:redox-sensing transcriptional repressor